MSFTCNTNCISENVFQRLSYLFQQVFFCLCQMMSFCHVPQFRQDTKITALLSGSAILQVIKKCDIKGMCLSRAASTHNKTKRITLTQRAS